MPARRQLPWNSEERAILREHYPAGGLNAVADLLPERSWHAIHVMAHKLGVASAAVSDAPRPKLEGDRLEEAIRLREEDGWSFARIGAHFGVCEMSASNAVLIALCPRRGFTPIERDARGRITSAGLDRLRLALRKGLKGVDIQLRLGVSAGRIALERRRYSRDLKTRGKAPLPPPGGGEVYSGVKLTAARKREVEALFLEGCGAKKITLRTGVSNTSVGRIRSRLIKRLARKGEALPGCDAAGNRRGRLRESYHYCAPEAVAELRRRILAREPVARAARDLGIGGSAAYRIRDALVSELAARGQELPPPLRPATRAEQAAVTRAAAWLPEGKRARYRVLTHDHGLAEAKRLLLAEIAAERTADAERQAAARRSETFQDKLARVARGEARVVARIPLRRADPSITLGGVASGALA